MKIYLIREAGTTKIHGIFWAKNPADLWDAVDYMSDPPVFEHAEIRSAGGIWHDFACDETKATDQSDDSEDDFVFHPMSQTSDAVFEVALGQTTHQWVRFDYTDEGVGLLARIFREPDAAR